MPSTIGHGPGRWWPLPLVKQRLYDTRPDLIKSKTYKQQWTQLQSRSRFLQALFCCVGPPSHILYNVFWPWLAHVLLSVAVGLDIGPLVYIKHDNIFAQSFSYTSFILSLLLAFRLKATYDRWNEARKSLAATGSAVMTLCQQATAWIEDPDIVEDFKRWGTVWLWMIHQCAMSASELDARGKAVLYPEELELLTAKGMPGCRARQMVQLKFRQLAKEANLSVQYAVCLEAVIDRTAVGASDVLRLRFQAMPHGLSLLCTGLVTLWCLFLPFGLTAEDDLTGIVPIVISSAMVSLCMLACDEIAHQMEDPFRLLPVEMIMDVYQKQALERVQEDNASFLAATAAGRLQRRKAFEQGVGEEESHQPPVWNSPCKPGTRQEAVLPQLGMDDITIGLFCVTK